jgi:hypothetical protein
MSVDHQTAAVHCDQGNLLVSLLAQAKALLIHSSRACSVRVQ